MTVAAVLRGYSEHQAEGRSPLMVALLRGAADDWDAGGPVRAVLGSFADDPVGSALPLRFAAALHRLVLTRQAPELALHYLTVGGTASASEAWPAARRVLETQGEEVRRLTALPCQTNEVGRCVALVLGLQAVALRVGRPLRLLEIGASAGLGLAFDRYRYGSVGPADSPCQLPDPGLRAMPVVTERAGCDLHPLDPTSAEGRLRLSASVWGDQVERFTRLTGALAVATRSRTVVERASAAEWLTRVLPEGDPGATVVWHSVMSMYVDPAEWSSVRALTANVWRLSYEPEQGGIALRLFAPGDPAGELLAYGAAHGPPLRPMA